MKHHEKLRLKLIINHIIIGDQVLVKVILIVIAEVVEKVYQ